MTCISLQNVPQVTVVKNAKVVTAFRFAQKILRMIIKTATEVKIVKTVKIKVHIKIKNWFRLKMVVVKKCIYFFIVLHKGLI